MLQDRDIARAKRRSAMLSSGTVGAIAFAANTALAGAALALFRQDPPGALNILMLPGRAIATLLVGDDRVNPFGGFHLLAICTATNAVGGFALGAACAAVCMAFRGMQTAESVTKPKN